MTARDGTQGHLPRRLRMLLAWLPLVLCGGISLLWPAAACGQDAATGAADVLARDRTGAALAGATATLFRRGEVGAVSSAATDIQGEVLFEHLSPGEYRLELGSPGLATATVDPVAVVLGETQRLVIAMHAAGTAQSVDVRAEAVERPSLADSPVNGSVVPEEMAALPIEGRRFQDYALLTPLVTEAADGAAVLDSDAELSVPMPETDAVALSVRGVSPSQNSFAVEGGPATRSFDGSPRGGNAVPFTLPLEAVREFEVRGAGAATRLGRDAGGAVHAVTRMGREGLHGSAFLLLRNNGVGATNPLAIATRYVGGVSSSGMVKPRDQREQFGASVGDGVRGTRERLFYFVAVEAQRRSFPAIASPSNAQFYQLTPMQTALLQNRGVTLPGIAKGLAFLDSLTGEVPRYANELAARPRMDWQASGKDLVTVAGTGLRFGSPAGLQSAPVVARGRASLGLLETRTEDVLVRWTHGLGARWLAESTVSAARDGSYESSQPPLAEEPHTALDGGAPEVAIAGEFSFGSPVRASRRRLPEEQRFALGEALSFQGGAHSVAVGVEGAWVDTRLESLPIENGSYDYTSGTTRGRAGGLVDFLTDYTFSALSYPNGGCPSIFSAVHLFCYRSYTQSFGVAGSRFHTGEWTAFARDGWRLTSRLRAEAGVQYEYQRMPPPQRPNAALDAVFGDFAASGSMPKDTNNVGPHASVAYSPGREGNSVVRLGYGVHFGRVPGRVLQTAIEDTALPSSTYRLRLTPSTEIAARCASAGTNFGYPATYACAPFGPAEQTTSAVMFARSFQLPMVQEAELTMEREVARGLTVSATYLLAMERQMLNSTDINVLPSTREGVFQIVRGSESGAGAGTPGVRDGEVFRVPVYSARVTPLFGPVTAIMSNGSGSYSAVVTRVEQRARRGLSYRGAWTYAKSLGYSGMGGAAVRQDAQFDPFDVRYDRAASNDDHRHKVVAAAVWRPEVAVEGWRGALLREWSVSPLVFVTSGRPYSYGISGGSALPGGRQSINASGGATYLPTVGRNTLRLPWTETVDLRVTRGMELRPKVRGTLSAEAYNLLNHANTGAVQQRAFLVGTPVNGVTPLVFQDAAAIRAEGLNQQPFGTATLSQSSVDRERRLQFGLRVQW